MNATKLADWAEQLVRERGYISATELASSIAEYMCENAGKIERDIPIFAIFELLKERSGIHSVEYANRATASFRIKDLFYHNPNIGK